MAKKKSIFGTALGYGVGAIGLDLSYGMFYSYLSYYLSSVLGLQEGFLLLITPLARIWDGINDPMMGTVVDNTRTKFGKYRPWILIGALCNAVVLFLLFTSFGMSGLPLYIYIGIMYVLWGMTNTMADIPYWSMVPSFTSEEKERNLVATVARSFSGIGQGIISILTPIICPLLSSGITDEKGYSASGFSRWAGICGVALVFFALVCVLITKETNVVYGEKKKFSLKQIFTVIKNNDQLVVFIVFAMLSNAGWYLTSSTAVYYFTDTLGNSKLQSLFQTIGTVGSVLGLLVVPVLTKWFSKRQTYTISLVTAIVGYGNSTSAPLERIELSAETTTIAPSKSLQITVTYYPENAEKPELYWKSSNHDVALVGMNGKVTAFEVGTATITAYTYDEMISASIDITVADNSPITFADSDVLLTLNGEAVTWAVAKPYYESFVAQYGAKTLSGMEIYVIGEPTRNALPPRFRKRAVLMPLAKPVMLDT